ncbi:HNH endonuclease [Bradyrhizobium sp. RDM4]|uniref:HNH endonuclease n=1 Tax=Bradyrhizobium sp. RDM4 TaxID=3378765 RepID=UPI0038FD1722
MAFGVFIHRSDSIYDDSPAERYQFPSQYLHRVEACVGDWVIYYEPSKVADTRGYFAIARVQQVIPDPGTAGMYLAVIEPGSYLDFANPVAFNGSNGPVERGILNEQGRISGRAQSAVRPVSHEDFDRICELGFAENVPLLPRRDDDVRPLDLNEEQALFRFDQQRDRVSLTVSRILRDRIFRRIVLRAYDERCAITGLKLINGMGRAEVAAAHIRPVEANGPDIVSNGIALSGTAHWMFDRGLISLADDLEILISRQTNDPESVRSIVNKTGHALEPRRLSDRPHPHFLKWHRDNCFKQ